MQFIADIIDQMDLALDQLSVRDRNFDRFALMLIDNAVELTLHRFVQDKANENEMWGKWSKPKYNPQDIQKARSQNFDQKVKFALKYGLCSQEAFTSILNMHSIRNTAFHQGKRHEGILHSATSFYFSIACNVCQRYKPFGWCSSNDNYTHRARKYLGNASVIKAEVVVPEAFLRLEEVVNSMKWDIISDLSKDLESTINEVDDQIQFLSEHSSDKSNRNQVIIDCQAWPFAFSEKAKMFARERGCTEKTVGSYVEWIKLNYKWTINTDPIPGWKKRLDSLQQEKNKHSALNKYCDFMKQTNEIRDKILDAAAQLDAHID
jgi:hypothetical protein